MKLERKQPRNARRISQHFSPRIPKVREEYWNKACATKPDRPACKVYDS